MPPLQQQPPLVSVISPVLKPKTTMRHLRRLQKSLASQSYGRAHIEHVVVGSASFINKRTLLPQDQWIPQPVSTIYEAYNSGIDAARGKYLCFLPHDSYFLHKTIEAFIDTIQTYGADYSYGPTKLRYNNLRRDIHQTIKPLEYVYIRAPFPLQALCITKRCLQEVGKFDTHLSYAADYDLIFRMYRQHKKGMPFLLTTAVHPPPEQNTQLHKEEAQVRQRYYFAQVSRKIPNDTTVVDTPEGLRKLIYTMEDGLELAPLVPYFSYRIHIDFPPNWRFIAEKIAKGLRILAGPYAPKRNAKKKPISELNTQPRNSYRKTDARPLVSIITPTYNLIKNGRTSVFHTMMESIAAQTYGREHIEHIIVDGNSTDGTEELLQQYSMDQYINESDTSTYQAINKGIKIARGKFINILNSDDLLYPYAIEVSVAALLATKADFSYGRHVKLRKGSRPYPNNWLLPLEAVYMDVPIFSESMLIRKECFQELGYLDENMRIASDYDFMFKLHLHKNRGIPLFEFIAGWRPGGISEINKSLFHAESAITRRRHLPPEISDRWSHFPETFSQEKKLLRESSLAMDNPQDLIPLIAYVSRRATLHDSHRLSDSETTIWYYRDIRYSLLKLIALMRKILSWMVRLRTILFRGSGT